MNPTKIKAVRLVGIVLLSELLVVWVTSGAVAPFDAVVAVVVAGCVAVLCLETRFAASVSGLYWGVVLCGVVVRPLLLVSHAATIWVCIGLVLATGLISRRHWGSWRLMMVPVSFGGVVVVAWVLDGLVDFLGTLALLGLLLVCAVWLVILAPKRLAMAFVALCIWAGVSAVSLPDFVSVRSPSSDGRPDILLITIDTLRTDVAEQMDSLTAVGHQGVGFPHVMASSPWTLPSMATIHTGALPREHHATVGQDGGFQAISASVPTLAMALSGVGYQTFAVLGPNPFVGAPFGFSRGFDWFYHGREESRLALPRGAYPGSIGRPSAAHLGTMLNLVPAPIVSDAKQLVSQAVRVLDNADNRPVFLWLHILDPHLPYSHAMDADLGWRKRVALTSLNRRTLLSNDEWRTHSGLTALTRGYANEVRHVDGAIKPLVTGFLESSPNTVVVLTSDHGEEFLDHGQFEHGHSLYGELINVPLVVAGIDDLLEDDSWMSLTQLAPTILRAAGVATTRPGLDTSAPQLLVSGDLLYPQETAHVQAVRQGPWKLILGNNQQWLYQTVSDPMEMTDISESRVDVVGRLRNGREENVPFVVPIDLGVTDRGMLEALGYIEQTNAKTDD